LNKKTTFEALETGFEALESGFKALESGFRRVMTVSGDFVTVHGENPRHRGSGETQAWVSPNPSCGSLQTHNGAAGLVMKRLRRSERRTASRGSANLQVRSGRSVQGVSGNRSEVLCNWSSGDRAGLAPKFDLE
jgi:hypothetical protein